MEQQSNSNSDPPDRWIVLASLSAVIAFLTGGLFETNFYDSEMVMLAYLPMSLPFVYNNHSPLKSQTVGRK